MLDLELDFEDDLGGMNHAHGAVISHAIFYPLLEELLKDGEDDELEGIGRQEEKTGAKIVRCASIDNFQGEESDIVIISLVRSNKHGNIGFLKEAERVNVLLSRAKHGMFIIGNTATLRSSSKGKHVWTPILDMFESKGRIVRSFPTICQLHPTDDIMYCVTPQDFRSLRPNGGCRRLCTARLNCGHTCPLMCHPTDQRHLITHRQCTQPCRRIPPKCQRNHPCTKLCNDACGRCLEIVEETILTCGHAANNPTCDSVRDDESLLVLAKQCRQKSSIALVHVGTSLRHTVATPIQKHPSALASVARFLSADILVRIGECSSMDAINCVVHCATLFAKLSNFNCMFAHSCQACKDGKHSCKLKCERTLFCGHQCGRDCHGSAKCPPCNKKCSLACVHSTCGGKCKNVCAPCVEECDWQCNHQGRCGLVCGAPCNRLPCNKRCDKILSCGHQCPSVCGEDCPEAKFCVHCCSVDKKSMIVDMIEFATYEDHDLDADPIIFLKCGHYYSMSTLDGLMELDKAYETENEGVYVGLKDLATSLGDSKPKSCPDCRTIIQHVKRYGRLISFQNLRFLERKHMISIETRLGKYSTIVDENNDEDRLNAMIQKLAQAEKEINAGPMRRVFEACGGKDVDVSHPPTRPILQLSRLRAFCFSKLVTESGDDFYDRALEVYDTSIIHADADSSRLLASRLRLDLCRLLMNWNTLTSVRGRVIPILDRVIDEGIDIALVNEAAQLKEKCMHNEELKEVLRAMNVVDGYNYGGGWSSHWYECPNGHPFFIGECGMAMQESRCYECGAPVGGGNHRLLSSNRSARGAIAETLRDT